MFAAFGSRVTVIESNERLLPRKDQAIAQAVTDLLHADGIEVLTGSAVLSMERAADGQVTTRLADGTRLTGDDVLVAVGRTPVTADLALEAARMKTGQGGFVGVASTSRRPLRTPGLRATWQAARSSHMCRWTTTGSSRPASRAVTARPAIASSPTPSSSRRSRPGWA
jgi:hypothetical protein